MSDKENSDQKIIRNQLESEEKELLKKCQSDGDCGTDQVCAFNETNETHYCVSNKLYLGCLKPTIQKKNYIVSNQENDVSSFKSCYEFARKLNHNDIIYNYLLYQPKQETPIKKSLIQASLHCADMKLLELPYYDSFTEDCNASDEYCKVVPKENIQKIIAQNGENCKKDYHLRVSYRCDLQNKEENLRIPLGGSQPVEFELQCPIGKDPKYAGKCVAYSLDPTLEINPDDALDKSIIPQNCPNPTYRIPNIIEDVSVYKLKSKEKLMKNMERYQDMIKKDEAELNKAKAIQYMLDYEKKFGRKISYEDALEHIQAVIEHAENAGTACSQLWDTNTGLNKIPFSIADPLYNDPAVVILNLMDTSGSYILFADYQAVIDQVCGALTTTTYPDYIIYFKNDPSNGTQAGKAYALSFEFLSSQNKVNSNDWATSPNNITLVNKSNETQTKISNYLLNLSTTSYNNVQSTIDDSISKLEDLQKLEEEKLTEKKDEMDRLIQMMNQKIRNNNYQADMNKKIIQYIYVFLIFALIALILYFVFRNSGNAQNFFF